ncbi:hypothetical protein HanPI659440_Chr09g0328641 [Helianthus annuus]|nr:hypothetical protein HanPI659440_Chr09g0328641 [Helianthus annuus]
MFSPKKVNPVKQIPGSATAARALGWVANWGGGSLPRSGVPCIYPFLVYFGIRGWPCPER